MNFEFDYLANNKAILWFGAQHTTMNSLAWYYLWLGKKDIEQQVLFVKLPLWRLISNTPSRVLHVHDYPSMSSFIVELMYLLTRVYCGCQRWAIRAAHMAATSKEGLLELRRVTESKIDLHEDDNEIPGDVWGLLCDVFEDVRLAKK